MLMKQFALAIMIAIRVVAQTGVDAPPFPPPGKLVDIGGWRLHLYCTGEAKPSQPTVILEAGVGDFSVEWGLVQPRVATFARVCSYDRAGDGWSDLGPHPRTIRQIVYELHTLLEKDGVRPPYVLVGHSFGGWPVRLYASTYPTEVVGMVLVEGGYDNPIRLTANGKEVRASELATGRAIPELNKTTPLRESDVPLGALNQMKAGGERSIAKANEPPRDKLPAEAQRMRVWAIGRWQHAAAAVNPFEVEEFAILRTQREKSPYPLGDMPLIVLTRGVSDEDGPDGKAHEADRRKEHAELTKMSRNGKQIIAEGSGHHIQIQDPELVTKWIQEVVGASRPVR
jgi:pimeloyl-ACP methyl ester carboxylesterase